MIEERGIEGFLEGRGELPSQSLEEKGRSGVGESFPLSAVWAGEDGLETQTSFSALDELRNNSAVLCARASAAPITGDLAPSFSDP
jgi:hypothetical protein